MSSTKISTLKQEVREFQKVAEVKLNEAIQKNCAEVISRLLPVVKQKPPERWLAGLGRNPDEGVLRRRLEEELKSAYGDASDYLDHIVVRLIYKDITVEMLRDQDFANAALKARLYLDEMYEEYQVARERE